MHELRQPIDNNLVEYAQLLDASTSTEGLDILTQLPKFFTKKLSNIVDFFSREETALKEYSVKELNVYAKDLHTNRYKLNKASHSIDIGNIKRRMVPVTIGLDVDVLALARTLTDANKTVKDNLEGLLNETSTTIAKLVSDLDYRLSSRPVIIDKKYSNAVKSIEKDLASLLSPKQTKDTLPISKVMPTLPHIVVAVELALDYSGGNIVDTHTKMLEEVATIRSYSETLYQEFQKDGINVKKVRVAEVAEYLQTAANFITQATNVMYMSNQSVIIMNNIIKTITK